jgi:hypothetical protein
MGITVCAEEKYEGETGLTGDNNIIIIIIGALAVPVLRHSFRIINWRLE